MLVKINKHGKGAGASAINYLLGSNRDRAGARVLQGNPYLTEKLIDATDYSRRYTSGTLSFEEASDSITEEQKKEIMQKFEDSVFSGLETDQYNILWVEHVDKNRLELNFLIPNQELRSGKRLQPYYHAADKRRINNFQTIINYEYKLTDPHDESKKRTVNPYSNGGEKIVTAYVAKDLKDIDNTKELRVEINRRLNDQHELNKRSKQKDWQIRGRKGVIEWLEQHEMKIERVTKNSISVSSPNSSIVRNIRLTGALYVEKYQAHRLIAEQQYEATGVDDDDYHKSLKDWREGLEIKKEYHLKRFTTSEPSRMALNDVLDIQTYDSSSEHLKASEIANTEHLSRPKPF